MDPSRRPNPSFLTWAKEGLSESEEDPFDVRADDPPSILGNPMEDSETGMKSWFYAKGSAFGPNAWDKLVGDVECSVVEEADHISMVVPPTVSPRCSLLSTYAFPIMHIVKLTWDSTTRSGSWAKY